MLNLARQSSSLSSSSGPVVHALNICILSGSTRMDGAPPRPILSPRITRYIESAVAKRSLQHNVTVIQAKTAHLPLLERPHFTYSKSQPVPPELSVLHESLFKADAYIVITPEYNHSPCPGLMNLMNHFGSSVFSFKPSGIVSYSAGQWGGTRAAHSLRPFLSELGCLPVSAMVHFPKAAQLLDEEGCLVHGDQEKDWDGYVDRMLSQLEWWGIAAKEHRARVNPFETSPAFRTSPSERNAPN